MKLKGIDNMAKVKMSIHRALSELKTYEGRINKILTTSDSKFVDTYRTSTDSINGVPISDISQSIQSNFDKVQALISNYKKIKSAIVLSNASDKPEDLVTIGGIQYTVAEAIERKNSIQFDIEFQTTLQTQYRQAQRAVRIHNEEVQKGLEQYLTSVLGDQSVRTPEEVEKYTKAYEDRQSFGLLDPCKIADKISKMEEEILTFMGEVDYILSESNAIKTIEIDLQD